MQLKTILLKYVPILNLVWMVLTFILMNYQLDKGDYIIIGILLLVYIIVSNIVVYLNQLNYLTIEYTIAKAITIIFIILLSILMIIFYIFDISILSCVIAGIVQILLLVINYLSCKIWK